MVLGAFLVKQNDRSDIYFIFVNVEHKLYIATFSMYFSAVLQNSKLTFANVRFLLSGNIVRFYSKCKCKGLTWVS